MKLICVCGVGCSGKSYHVDEILKEYKEQEKPRPLVLKLGEFFRIVFGVDFFVHLDNPSAPAETEHWVRNLVSIIIDNGVSYSRDVILDGFPRTTLQFEWLIYSSPASKFQPDIEVVFILPPEGILDDRIKERIIFDPDGYELIEARIIKDGALLHGVYTSVESAITHEKYTNLNLKRIEV